MSTRARVAKSVCVLVATAVVAGCGSGPGSGLGGGDAMTVTADFDNAAGLYVGNDVALLGISIGKVKSIALDGGYVAVEMSIDKNAKIPADAKAVTVSTSVLTDRHVEFTPPYRGGPIVRDHDVLGLERTKTPVSFDRVFAVADKLSTELQGDGQGHGPVADLVGVGASMTAGNGQKIRDAFDEMSKAMRMGPDGGAQTKKSVTSIVQNLDHLTQAATDNDRTIREFGSSVRQLSDMLSDQNLGSGDTGATLNRIMEQTDSLLTNNRAKLQSSVADAQVVTKSIADYRREVEEFLDILPLLMDNAYHAVDFDKRGIRVHALVDKVVTNEQMAKEVCNLLGLRQLGCDTGKMQDYGPDFGAVSMLDGIAKLAGK